MEVLLLPVMEELYAVPVHAFREVVAAPRVTQLPTAPPAVLGLINVRGEIVPLLDMASLMEIGTLAASPYAAVLETDAGSAAFATTAAPTSEPLGDRVGASTVAGARGVYRQGERLAVLVDAEALLSRIRQ